MKLLTTCSACLMSFVLLVKQLELYIKFDIRNALDINILRTSINFFGSTFRGGFVYQCNEQHIEASMDYINIKLDRGFCSLGTEVNWYGFVYVYSKTGICCKAVCYHENTYY